MIERFPTLPRGRNRHVQVLADAILPDVLVQRARTKPRLVLDLLVHARSRQQTIVGHRKTRNCKARR
jgi:hypothetical protein